jgi:NAD(P)H-dependent flavin oxidoreductase YrpB (nitropropane dioxygenase family)
VAAVPAPSPGTGTARPELPQIIQGGMGVGVSSWRLAASVARAGQLGVVSGTALNMGLARRLQDGDEDGEVRRALAAFPNPDAVARIMRTYFREGGRATGVPYRPVTKLAMHQSDAAQELAIVGNFVEVWLAKDGHSGLVGINYLEKIQLATPAAAYGAMLAGVDYVIMGAGLPREIPHLLNELAQHRAVNLPVDVHGAPAGTHSVALDPSRFVSPPPQHLARPAFLAVISATVLATYLSRDEHIRPEGFVVEGPTAGGHNAPPRDKHAGEEPGAPIFGPRDLADIDKIAGCGLPFWLAGGYGTPEALHEARARGAHGVQIGTLFALSKESGLTAQLRDEAVAQIAQGTLAVETDLRASPTGFPFKVAQLPGTLSDVPLAESRVRVCDLGFLGTPFVRSNGTVANRCPAEPVATYVRKGGNVEDTVGRVCLCNALSANIGMGQTRPDGDAELPLLTLGDDLDGPKRLAEMYPDGWTAREAVRWLLEN